MKPTDADHPHPDHPSRCSLGGRSPLPDHTSGSPRRSGQEKDAPIKVELGQTLAREELSLCDLSPLWAHSAPLLQPNMSHCRFAMGRGLCIPSGSRWAILVLSVNLCTSLSTPMCVTSARMVDCSELSCASPHQRWSLCCFHHCYVTMLWQPFFAGIKPACADFLRAGMQPDRYITLLDLRQSLCVCVSTASVSQSSVSENLSRRALVHVCVCMYVCVCVCKYVCTYIYICVYMWKYVRVCVWICVCVCVTVWMSIWIYIYMYIYIYAVELKLVQDLPFSVLKTGPILCFFFVFENLVLPAERRGCFENKAKKTNFDPVLVLKNWSNFVAQHTWTSF